MINDNSYIFFNLKCHNLSNICLKYFFFFLQIYIEAYNSLLILQVITQFIHNIVNTKDQMLLATEQNTHRPCASNNSD